MMFKGLIVAVSLTLAVSPSLALAGPLPEGSAGSGNPDYQWNAPYPEKNAALAAVGDASAATPAIRKSTCWNTCQPDAVSAPARDI